MTLKSLTVAQLVIVFREIATDDFERNLAREEITKRLQQILPDRKRGYVNS